MNSKYIELIKKHISTHTEQSAEDRSAVSYLESVLSPDGRINTSFASDDKWPNHDGMFEYVPNPDVSRHPVQNFVVQIKGTNNYTENNAYNANNTYGNTGYNNNFQQNSVITPRNIPLCVIL